MPAKRYYRSYPRAMRNTQRVGWWCLRPEALVLWRAGDTVIAHLTSHKLPLIEQLQQHNSLVRYETAVAGPGLVALD